MGRRLRGVLLSAALALSGCREAPPAAAPGHEATMANDPYFNAVWLQLVETPAASRAALLAAQQAPAIPPEHDVGFPLAEARSWAATVLKPAFAPPVGAHFLGFPKEEGRFDVVRAVWGAGGLEIEIAETAYVISVKVRGVQVPPHQPPADTAAAVAQQLLATGEPARFADEGLLGARTHGKRILPAAGRIDPEWPYWEDTLRFWMGGGELGFLTLKAAGGPTREVIGCGEGLNKVWFR